jgi:hypothetical protein
VAEILVLLTVNDTGVLPPMGAELNPDPLVFPLRKDFHASPLMS